MEATAAGGALVTDQSGEARYPSFKGIMAAKKKPAETWALSDLGIDGGEVGGSAGVVAGKRRDRAPAGRGHDRHRRRRRGRQSSSSGSSPRSKFI